MTNDMKQDDSLFYSKRRTEQVTAKNRKHVTQMTDEEKVHCIKLLQASLFIRDSFTFSTHAKEKIGQFIDMPTLYRAIGDEQFLKDFVIEYSMNTFNVDTKTPNYKAVNIQYPKIVEHQGHECRLMLVIDFQLGKVVTAYYNQVDDNHSTLNMSTYDKDLQILPRFK